MKRQFTATYDDDEDEWTIEIHNIETGGDFKGVMITPKKKGNENNFYLDVIQ